MRVIAGECKGRHLHAMIGQGTRPTADRVKESVFNILGPFFAGGAVLDLFAGTGALGIEALSRGVGFAHFIEKDPQAVQMVRENVKRCGFEDKCSIWKDDAQRAIARLASLEQRFDLVFLDPPYRYLLVPSMIDQLQQRGLLSEGATIVSEHDSKVELPGQILQFTRFRLNQYGSTSVSFYHQGGGVT